MIIIHSATFELGVWLVMATVIDADGARVGTLTIESDGEADMTDIAAAVAEIYDPA